MRALVYTAPHAIEMRDVPDPSPEPGEVVLRVRACGICGSDLHGFRGKSRIRVPPAVLGHECTGAIAAVGAGVDTLRAGDRAVIQPLIGCGLCRYCQMGRSNICPERRLIGAHLPGGFADYVRVPRAAVYAIPDTLPDADATLVEPLGNAIHVLGLGGEAAGGIVVVIGAGTLGLLTVAVLGLRGARRVISVDLDPHRLEVARRLGADDVLDARDSDLARRMLELTGGGADLVVEAVGVGASRTTAIQAAGPGGTVVLLGNAESESTLPVNDAVNRELVLRGSYSCTDSELREAIDVLARGGIDTSWVETAPLEHGPAMFGRLHRGHDAPIKAVLVP